MKGVIFVELVEFVETHLGLARTDRILSMPELASGGAYTAVGTYSVGEAVSIVSAVAAESQTPIPELLRAFGEHLFSRLAERHPKYVAEVQGPGELLRQIENHIHVEVQKLYPDAELPRFDYEDGEEGEIVMVYRSSRGLADLCEGLIRGCYAYFGVPLSLSREPLPGGSPGTAVRFRIREG